MLNSITERLRGVRKSWSGGLLSVFSSSVINEEFWEELEENLISGDVSMEIADELLDSMKALCRRKNIKEPPGLLEEFRHLLVEKLNLVEGMGREIDPHGTPAVVVLVGVNGSGKTTSAGKLASRFADQGKKVIFAASDTFRAAAVEQLKIWGTRTGVRVIAQEQGSDPAAVAFDAISAARSSGADIVIVDTAGRLHSKHNLMEELSKIHKVITREVPEEDLEVLLVLDAVMGQNGFRQAQAFNQALPLTGVILAKYDSTAKGGIILTIAEQLQLPIRYIGLGEGVEDLTSFHTDDFVKALLFSNNKDHI
ncbi:MAG: signal recognition particle-docking protein FtsY [Synergistales bacterium]|nr:signal recognition particle-docking protein FtsY [Synergistales bacterium]